MGEALAGVDLAAGRAVAAKGLNGFCNDLLQTPEGPGVWLASGDGTVRAFRTPDLSLLGPTLELPGSAEAIDVRAGKLAAGVVLGRGQGALFLWELPAPVPPLFTKVERARCVMTLAGGRYWARPLEVEHEGDPAGGSGHDVDSRIRYYFSPEQYSGVRG